MPDMLACFALLEYLFIEGPTIRQKNLEAFKLFEEISTTIIKTSTFKTQKDMLNCKDYCVDCMS